MKRHQLAHGPLPSLSLSLSAVLLLPLLMTAETVVLCKCDNGYKPCFCHQNMNTRVSLACSKQRRSNRAKPGYAQISTPKARPREAPSVQLRLAPSQAKLPSFLRVFFGLGRAGSFYRVCHTESKVRLRLPHAGFDSVLEGYRLMLLPKFSFFAL